VRQDKGKIKEIGIPGKGHINFRCLCIDLLSSNNSTHRTAFFEARKDNCSCENIATIAREVI